MLKQKIKNQKSKTQTQKRKNFFYFYVCVFYLLFLVFGFSVVGGCGQVTTQPPAAVGDYTISGKVLLGASGGSVKAADTTTVTHVVAISANSEKYLADYNSSDGTFSVKVYKGWPYAVGFYNKTDSAITLLGYLKQKDVNWDSLPLMNPSGEATNLGTIGVNTASVEATPSIGLEDLLSEVKMSRAVANLYGNIDDAMTMFTNVDVDGNGIFDFEENKTYLFQVVVGMYLGTNFASGEVTKMLNEYNVTYYPVPANYQFSFSGLENNGANNPAGGTPGSIKFPETIYSANYVGHTTLTCSIQATTDSRIWSLNGSESLDNCEFITPEVVPSGTYTIGVNGRDPYTIRNVKGAAMVAIGTAEGIIFPVFKIATNEAGYLTTIYYKWMIRKNGMTEEATASEVKAVLLDTSLNSNNGNFIEPSPTISIYLEYPPTSDPVKYRPPKKIDRDGTSIDVSDWNAKWSDLVVFGANYLLNSNINCSYLFSK